ncbi:hypothetical protein [Lentzea sp. HUAS12]|uniref:hypothetical protein n=1 Tax=Lentzea sp. HUAS12 TaxID=2951806 RepID=UPI00209D2144|nr:hypothetical protein [Lentzea sp. HUAS12]USX54780.1 hypothetical protein ND450_11925 [Lentzea sp. HUAS12]
MNENQVQPLPGWRGGDGNAAYLDKNLCHRPMDLYLDDTVSWRVVFQLWARAAAASFLVWAVFGLLGFLVGLGSMSAGSIDTAAGAFVFWSIGNVGAVVVFFVVLLLTKLPEPVAEWRVVLTDRAEFAPSVYSQISGTLRHRQLPLDGGTRRIRTGAGPLELSHRLFLTEGDFRVYVSVFSYGTSLYLGWQMWRSRRGSTLIRQFLVGIVRGMSGQNDPEIAMLRADRARAMREAVHAACREGLMVAVEGIQVPEQFGFPYGMPPVEEGAFASGPVPGGYSPPVQHGAPPDTGRHSLPGHQ